MAKSAFFSKGGAGMILYIWPVVDQYIILVICDLVEVAGSGCHQCLTISTHVAAYLPFIVCGNDSKTYFKF